jgi:hypothetical protein
MPTPTLPTYVKIRADGFMQQRQSAVLRSEMDSGPPKQSKIYSRVLVTRPVRFLIESAANYAAFITWFNSDLNRGAEWFDWTDPVTDTVRLARIVGGQLNEERPLTPAMTHWEISCTLETWDA